MVLSVVLILRKTYRYDQMMDLSDVSSLARDVSNYRAWRGSSTTAVGTSPGDYALGSVTRLSQGDIALLGVNDGSPDLLSFVFFRSVSAGTQLYITDEAFTGGALQDGGEGTLTYKVPAGGLLAGDIISYDAGSPASAFHVSGAFEISEDGDQVLVYQGQGFLYGANTRGGWGYQGNSNTSDLPTGLHQYWEDVSRQGNGYYTGPTTGTTAQLQVWTSDHANWHHTGRQAAAIPAYPRFTILGVPQGGTTGIIGSSDQNYITTYLNRDGSLATA